MATSKSKKKVTARHKAAAGKKHKMGNPPFVPITVQNSVPTPDPAAASTSEMITFTNRDAVPYLIQLFATDGTPAMVEVLLTAGGQGGNGGTVNLIAGAAAGTCTYNILPWPGAKPSATGGGTHKITISSGVKVRAATAS